jgi:hypothetical protein
VNTEGQASLLVSKFVPGRHDDEKKKKKEEEEDHSGLGCLTVTRPS